MLAAAFATGCYSGVAAVYHHYHTRVIGVCVSTDFEYRDQRPDWQVGLRPLFDAVNRKFQGTGVQWLVKDGGESYPPGTRGTMMQRAADLADNSGCRADVVLGLTGQGSARNVVAPPFSHVLLIRDSSGNDLAMRANLVAWSLARLFGVADSTQELTAAEASKSFDAAGVRTIRSMRDYDFARGIAALTSAVELRAANGLAQALAGKAAHPDAEAHRILARSFTAARQYDDAIRHLREAVRIDPRNPDAHLELALAFEAASLTDQAIAELKTAARLEPDNAWTHATMGLIHLKQDNVDEAIDEFRAAARLDPKNAGYQAALGRAYSRQPGRIREASAAFEAALRLKSADPAAQAALTREAGVEQALLELVRQAEGEVRKTPGSAEACQKLGVAYAYAGNAGAARQEIERALQLKPGYGTAHLVLARLNYMSGQYLAAASELDAARAAGTTPGAAFADAVKRKLGN